MTMKTTTADSASASSEAQFTTIDPHLIDPSPYQPRRVYEPQQMAELEASIRAVGLIQPLVVRRSPMAEGRFELIVGERRLRSCLNAGISGVPILLRVVDDTTAEKMVLEENLQRADLTVSEEGRAFARLLAMRDAVGQPVYTQSSLADFIHKDAEYITARLRLVTCPEELIKAVDDKLVAVSVALLVGGIPDAKARAACAKEVLTPEIIDQQVPLNFAQTRELIREHFCVKLDAKRFDLNDANLVPMMNDAAGQRSQGGACTDCPFRSGNLEGVVLQRAAEGGEGGKKKGATAGAPSNLCTLPRCFKLKLDAQWLRVKEEKKDLRAIEGKAAQKVFSGHNGRVAWDSEYTSVDEEQSIDYGGYTTPRKALKGIKFEPVLAQHPETKQIVELIAKTELKRLMREKQGKGAGSPQSAEDAKHEEEQKERRKAELRQQKIDKLVLTEGIAEIRGGISEGRVKVDENFLSAMFETALDAAGSDGLKFMADTLELERDKQKGGYNLDKPIRAWVKANVETAPQWQSMITFTLLARQAAWQGKNNDHFKAFLSLCGLKVADLERRAKALLQGPPKKEAKSAAPAAKNSTDPTDVSADKEVSKTTAADARAKAEGIVRKVADYRCDSCDVQIYSPPGMGAKLCLIPPGELQCKKCGGEWENHWAGAKREGFDLPHQPFEAQVEGIASGEWTYVDCLGATPKKGVPAHKVWEAARVKLYKAVQKRLKGKTGQVDANGILL